MKHLTNAIALFIFCLLAGNPERCMAQSGGVSGSIYPQASREQYPGTSRQPQNVLMQGGTGIRGLLNMVTEDFLKAAGKWKVQQPLI